MSLAGPLGDFDAPGSQLPLRFTSTPERAMILLPLIFCGNRDSIHNPVEHGENHQEETMKTPNGEIVAMQWDHIHWDNRTLHIPDTKNGYPRTIPLTSGAIEVLRELPQTDTSVMAITGNAIRLAWERLKKKAEVTDLRFHDLRHEAISRFFEMGLSVPEVALISGHRDPRMLFRYTHLRAEEVGKKLG